MTIPSEPSLWCPTCEDTCHDHATMCTVCGTALQEENNDNNTRNNETRGGSSSTVAPPSFSLLGGSVEWQNELAATLASGTSTREQQNRIQSLRERQNELGQMLREAQQALLAPEGLAAAAIQQEQNWAEGLPAEAMDPQQAGNRSRPTSKQVLGELERILLTQQTSLLYHATVTVHHHHQSNTSGRSHEGDASTEFQAILGEFGPAPPHRLTQVPLIVAALPHRTGKGGCLHSTTLQAIKELVTQRHRVVLYMERGDNVTFVQKALLAQEAGASALVVGNRTSAQWPYSMKDSRGESANGALTIPVVMISQRDGGTLLQLLATEKNATAHGGKIATPALCSLDIQSKTEECVVCRDDFVVGQTVVRLPACGHVFHDTCATTWLSKHNSCPYCRRELPTDDANYEEERRRTQRTHAVGNGTVEDGSSSSRQADDFYG